MKPAKYSGKNREYTKWGKNFKEVRVVHNDKAVPPQPVVAPAPTLSLSAEPEPQAVTEEDVSQGVYSNFAVLTHTETEFLADFLFLAPGQQRAQVSRRVLLSPLLAKKICSALRHSLAQYEARFGLLKD